MTLLAQEATENSRKLLKKYNMPDAKNYSDLEAKLAELYFATPDKLQLEKDIANIHPHKDWILKRVEQPKVVVEDKKEISSNSSGAMICTHPYCPTHSRFLYGFDGVVGQQTKQENVETKKGSMQEGILTAIPILGLFGIIAVTFIIIHKTA